MCELECGYNEGNIEKSVIHFKFKNQEEALFNVFKALYGSKNEVASKKLHDAMAWLLLNNEDFEDELYQLQERGPLEINVV